MAESRWRGVRGATAVQYRRICKTIAAECGDFTADAFRHVEVVLGFGIRRAIMRDGATADHRVVAQEWPRIEPIVLRVMGRG